MLGKTRGPRRRLAGMAAVVLVTGLCVPGATSQAWGTSVIDFEDWTGGGDTQGVVESGGFRFVDGFTISVEPETGNDTHALHALDYVAKFWKDGETFSIASLDLQEGLGAINTVSIQLIGYREIFPTVVVQTFSLDGHSDTFETFYPVGFSDLTDAYVYAYDAQGLTSRGFSIDNIVVPEPGLLGIMLLSLGILTRRRTCR